MLEVSLYLIPSYVRKLWYQKQHDGTKWSLDQWSGTEDRYINLSSLIFNMT